MHTNDIEEAIQSIDRDGMARMLEASLPNYMMRAAAVAAVDVILNAIPDAISGYIPSEPSKEEIGRREKRRELIDSAIDDVVAGNDDVAYITDIADPERSSIEHVVISRGAL